MPDTRRHRGAHPEDQSLFGPQAQEHLRAAVSDLSWLLSRGYAEKSSLKLVGDRYGLRERQRVAVIRAACPDAARRSRQAREVSTAQLAGHHLSIDAYNLLTTVEAAMGGGVILACRDGCYRDMASMHGTYRKVAETEPAIQCCGSMLVRFDAAGCTWYLDRPVSNSGKLATLMAGMADEQGWNWDVQVVDNPDTVLITDENFDADPQASGVGVVVTADSMILDGCRRWCNLAREIVLSSVTDPWVINMAD